MCTLQGYETLWRTWYSSIFLVEIHILLGIKKQACKNRPKCLNEITEEGEEEPMQVEEMKGAPTKEKRTKVRNFSKFVIFARKKVQIHTNLLRKKLSGNPMLFIPKVTQVANTISSLELEILLLLLTIHSRKSIFLTKISSSKSWKFFYEYLFQRVEYPYRMARKEETPRRLAKLVYMYEKKKKYFAHVRYFMG